MYILQLKTWCREMLIIANKRFKYSAEKSSSLLGKNVIKY